MTPVNRPVRRETNGRVYSLGELRNVMVIIEPPGTLIHFRLKGMRQIYSLTTEFCYREAMRQELVRKQEAKKKKKVGR